MSYFDNLIRDGRDADAMRHFARTYYDNGKIGHTRMTLLVRVADEHDALKTENAKLRKVADAARAYLYSAKTASIILGLRARLSAALADLDKEIGI